MEYPSFDVEIVRQVDAHRLRWPSPGEAGRDNFGGNRLYIDVRDMSWEDATRAFAVESETIARLEKAVDVDAEIDAIDEECYESEDVFDQLDLGVASTVAALSANGCIPCNSCNGGAFDGGDHREDYPLVAFFAQPNHVPVLLAAATEVDVGLEVDDDVGCLVVYANDIRRLREFASRLITRKTSTR